MALSVAGEKSFGQESPDGELIALAREGSEQAVRILIQRYNQQLFRTARGVVGDDGDAEDVVQEAYVRAFTSLNSFRGEASFSTWLTRITFNVAYGRLRRERPTVDLSVIEQGAPDRGDILIFPTTPASTDPENETGREQVRQILERAIDEIPEPFRMVFILRDVQGLDIRETATLLSINPQTVKTRLFRARQHVRAEIEKVFSSGLSDVFPFDGARCANMADRVIEQLGPELI